MLGRVRNVLVLISVPFFLALISLCLVLVANMVTQSLLPAPLVHQVRKAFLAGDLPPAAIQELDRQRGALLYNDCLILGMALNRDPSLYPEDFLGYFEKFIPSKQRLQHFSFRSL